MEAPTNQAANIVAAAVPTADDCAAASNVDGNPPAGGDVSNNLQPNNNSSTTVTSSATNNNAANNNNFVCNICHEEHHTQNSAVVDGCGHSFCFMCIDKWTSTQRTCPNCRGAVKVIIIHDVSFPVKPAKLRIVVKNTSGWHRSFYVGRNNAMFVEKILDFYAQHNPVRQGDGTPLYAHNQDVFVFYDGSPVTAHNATPKRLGMLRDDVLVLRHKVQIRVHVPDKGWDMKYVTSWWDVPLEEFLRGIFDRLEANIDDYWIVYDNELVNELNHDDSLEELGIASGDVIRLYHKRETIRLYG